MNETKHTPEPWSFQKVGENTWLHGPDGRAIAFIGGKDSIFTQHPGTPHEANAARIVACVNEMKGLEIEEGEVRARLDNLHDLESMALDAIQGARQRAEGWAAKCDALQDEVLDKARTIVKLDLRIEELEACNAIATVDPSAIGECLDALEAALLCDYDLHGVCSGCAKQIAAALAKVRRERG